MWTGLGGSPYFTSWFSDNPGDVVSAQDFVDGVEGFVSSIANKVNSNLTWVGDANVTIFNPADGLPTGVTGVTPPTVMGTESNEVLPLASQGLLHLRTGAYRDGREVRGRLFLPGAGETSNNFDGTPSATYHSVIDAAAAVLVADASAGWCVWSRPKDSGIGLMFPILQANLWAQWAVLRSRRD